MPKLRRRELRQRGQCEKFSTYILGRSFVVESDHKPLVPLLNTKHLDNLPPRILRFRFRPAKYDYIAQHVPGKLLYAADARSRAPTQEESGEELQEEVEAYMWIMSLCHLYLLQLIDCRHTGRHKWRMLSAQK